MQKNDGIYMYCEKQCDEHAKMYNKGYLRTTGDSTAFCRYCGAVLLTAEQLKRKTEQKINMLFDHTLISALKDIIRITTTCKEIEQVRKRITDLIEIRSRPVPQRQSNEISNKTIGS